MFDVANRCPFALDYIFNFYTTNNNFNQIILCSTTWDNALRIIQFVIRLIIISRIASLRLRIISFDFLQEIEILLYHRRPRWMIVKIPWSRGSSNRVTASKSPAEFSLFHRPGVFSLLKAISCVQEPLRTCIRASQSAEALINVKTSRSCHLWSLPALRNCYLYRIST